MIADTKAPDGTQAFAESAYNKIHPVFHAGFLGKSAASLAEHPQRMGFINQQKGAISFFYGRNIRQGGTVAQHAVNSLNHNKSIRGTVTESLEPLFQNSRIVVPESKDLSTTKPAALIDACMTVGIDQ